MKKIKISDIKNKKNKSPIISLALYSKVMAEIADKHCHIILVGDSLGMTLHGMNSTKEVKIDTMILHGKTVSKATKRSLVVVDMPYKTYTNKFLAYKNAKRIIRETKCDAIKIEGGSAIGNIIKYLVSNNIQVMGHVGLLPQSANKFKLKGRNTNEKRKILNDAIEVSRSGAFAIVVECVIEDLAKEITRRISVPTIGIGASKYCDGQILVADDMLGLTNFTPKFVKIYDNLKKNIDKSIKKYSKDVKVRKFPSTKNVYKR